jgi:hypothetical protein
MEVDNARGAGSIAVAHGAIILNADSYVGLILLLGLLMFDRGSDTISMVSH